LISVCLATCNGERFVAEQIASILQSPRVGELVVSDDGSVDRTRDIVLGFKDPRVRLLDGPHAGVVRNFEFLLTQARGDRIFLADQDDVWLPEKVEVMTAALDSADLVVSDCVVVDGALAVMQPSFFAARASGPGLLRNLTKNSFLGCCIAIDRRLLARALPFPSGIPMHDWWLGLVAQQFGRVAFIAKPLMLYRRHGANASSTSERSATGLWTRLRWRARLVRALLLRALRVG